MKRRVAKLVAFLLLGGIINVAVAWGCTVWSDPLSRYHYLISLPPVSRPQRHNELDESWITQTSWEASEGWRAVSGMPLEAFGIERQAFFELPDKPIGWSGEKLPFAARTRAGWPVQSLEGSIWFLNVKKARRVAREQRRFVHSIAVEVNTRPAAPIRGVSSSEERALPLLPIWPGFAVFMIFYAAILWLLTLGPFTARRMIRAKRGHCIKCGYDLRGTENEKCPECGWNRES